jgi:hypothetical protein
MWTDCVESCYPVTNELMMDASSTTLAREHPDIVDDLIGEFTILQYS